MKIGFWGPWAVVSRADVGRDSKVLLIGTVLLPHPSFQKSQRVSPCRFVYQLCLGASGLAAGDLQLPEPAPLLYMAAESGRCSQLPRPGDIEAAWNPL